MLSDFIVKTLWPNMGNTKIYGSLERNWKMTYSSSHIPRILINTKKSVCLLEPGPYPRANIAG